MFTDTLLMLSCYGETRREKMEQEEEISGVSFAFAFWRVE
jgi:hypothetical protein